MSDQKSDKHKTDIPIQGKLEKAREEGNLSISKKISSVMLMIVSIMVFVGSGGFMYARLEILFQSFFINSGTALSKFIQSFRLHDSPGIQPDSIYVASAQIYTARVYGTNLANYKHAVIR